MDPVDQARRGFLKGLAALPALAAAEPQPRTPFNGIQMGPHTMLDEGIDHCLDLIQDTAAINAVMIYSHTYHGDIRKAPQFLATDHGVAPRPMRGRRFPAVWVKTHEQYYKGTTLRPQTVDSSYEYANRDLFQEAREPTRRRGMKLYARILEGPSSTIVNRSKVLTRDVYGKTVNVACWNHPEYRAFWNGTVEDLFRTYDLDGFQWGAERMGPLMNVILPWNDAAPTCFCEFCVARGKAHGIDSERARKGFEDLYVYVRALMAGTLKPPSGVFTGFLGILIRYPEILSWEYQYRQAREEVQAGMYKTIKAIKPTADVGWHVDHQPSSWDLVYRAEMSYAEMAPHSDYIKFIAYHDVLGPRIRYWYLERFHNTILREVPLEESLDLYYRLFGYDPKAEPKLDELAHKGFSADYVYRETKRSVASAEGKTKIYTGIGFDVPWGNATMPADPEVVYECVLKSFDAGANGIVVSREYEEMRLPNLKAVGRAIREIK
ncbi:MAG TPA: hypothetical protein VN736_05190 [Candidatus Limnocylindrales bacterium]|nr:hypothetical protein [Candidatus Limnocylindrales bacterium]